MSLGVLGNIIVLYVIGYRKKKCNKADVYILVLACADIIPALVSCVRMLFYIIAGFSNRQYLSANCYALPATARAATCAAGWLHVLISLERYRYEEFSFISVHS